MAAKKQYKRHYGQAMGSARMPWKPSPIHTKQAEPFWLVPSHDYNSTVAVLLSSMAPLATKCFLLFASRGYALVLRDTALVMANPTANGLNLEPIPNPFPAPSTYITREFLPRPTIFGPQSQMGDVVRLFETARSDIEAYICGQGNGAIMPNEYLFDLGKVK